VLSFAKILTNSFSFGLQAKFAQEVIANVSVNNVLFDLGLTYNIGIKIHVLELPFLILA